MYTLHPITLFFQLMALLLLRHALTLTDEDDDDTSAVFSVSEGNILKIYCQHPMLRCCHSHLVMMVHN